MLYALVRPGWRRTGPFLPDAFVFGLLIYAIGATWILAVENLAGAYAVTAMAWGALASGTAGATLYCLLVAPRYDGEFLQFVRGCCAGPLEKAVILSGLAISSFICILFVYLVLKSDVIIALLGIGSFAGDTNLLEARIAMSSGSDTYLAPGYIKQFRDVLTPILLATMIILDRSNLKTPFFWWCVVVALCTMLISGQRLVVVVFLITLALASYYARRAQYSAVDSPRRPRVAFIPAALVIASYSMLTMLLGRIKDDAAGIAVAFSVAAGFLDRVFLAAPRENSITHAIWSESGPTVGASWLNDLSGIMPGVNENLSNILHLAIGGSAAGNSPLGLPADVWLAWGWPGILFVPALFGVAVGLLDLACYLRRSPLLVGLRFYLFLIIPVCYSPFIFLLYGGIVAIGVFAILIVIRPVHKQPLASVAR